MHECTTHHVPQLQALMFDLISLLFGLNSFCPSFLELSLAVLLFLLELHPQRLNNMHGNRFKLAETCHAFPLEARNYSHIYRFEVLSHHAT